MTKQEILIHSRIPTNSLKYNIDIAPVDAATLSCGGSVRRSNKVLDNARGKRVKRTGEIFTPYSLVKEILDKMFEYSGDKLRGWASVLDPTCGDGAILVPVLERKIQLGMHPYNALICLFGVELMPDNAAVCRRNLLVCCAEHGCGGLEYEQAVQRNIGVGDFLKFDLDNWCPGE